MSEKYGNIITNNGPVDRIPAGQYEGVYWTRTPPREIAERAGWREVTAEANIPEGHRVVTREFQQDDKTAKGAKEVVTTEPIPEPEPDIVVDADKVQFRFDSEGRFMAVELKDSEVRE